MTPPARLREREGKTRQIRKARTPLYVVRVSRLFPCSREWPRRTQTAIPGGDLECTRPHRTSDTKSGQPDVLWRKIADIQWLRGFRAMLAADDLRLDGRRLFRPCDMRQSAKTWRRVGPVCVRSPIIACFQNMQTPVEITSRIVCGINLCAHPIRIVKR